MTFSGSPQHADADAGNHRQSSASPMHPCVRSLWPDAASIDDTSSDRLTARKADLYCLLVLAIVAVFYRSASWADALQRSQVHRQVSVPLPRVHERTDAEPTAPTVVSTTATDAVVPSSPTAAPAHNKRRRQRPSTSPDLTADWTADAVALQPSMFVVENMRNTQFAEYMDSILPRSLHGRILLAVELSLMALFPMQRLSLIPAKLAVQIGRSLGWVYNIGRSSNVLMTTNVGRTVVRPIVSLFRTVGKLYRNRSRLSIVSEVTFYADIPPYNRSFGNGGGNGGGNGNGNGNNDHRSNRVNRPRNERRQ